MRIRLVCTFLYPFLHDYDVKMPNFAFYGVRLTNNDEMLFPFLNLDMVPRNSTPRGFAYIYTSIFTIFIEMFAVI